MAHIFISHVHEEAKLARAMAAFLKAFSLEAFLSSDNWQLRAGEQWFQRIEDELRSATIVVLLLSKRSEIRPWISFEAGWAWGTGPKIIPVCFGGLTKGSFHQGDSVYWKPA
ncbi:MAG: toll/interleukin-1 receptor domain-containing protein [Bryobacterales bacterium]|nr:toll/interleukin-1 receptor domain-containing protein [Bryobacterales bacterium]